jgi:hypothetical protein
MELMRNAYNVPFLEGSVDGDDEFRGDTNEHFIWYNHLGVKVHRGKWRDI